VVGEHPRTAQDARRGGIEALSDHHDRGYHSRQAGLRPAVQGGHAAAQGTRGAVSVIGAGRSGAAVAKLLHSHGAHVFVSDAAAAEKLQSSPLVLQSEKIEYEIGRHSDRVYESELMVISPGVPSHAPVVLEALKRKIKVVSELEAGSWFCRAPIVAITGSNGKTTTTTLTGRILSDAAKKHVVAGNIGTAFSSVVLELVETDIAVLEVSSFQLDDIDSFRPKISVLLNITPDHMDRYDHSMEKYAAAKARIFKNQLADDVIIYNIDDAWTNKMVMQARCRKIGFSIQQKLNNGAFIEDGKLITAIDGTRTEIIDINQIFIKGMHIAEYWWGNLNNHDPLRERKLLLTSRELRKIERKIKESGLTIIVIKVFISNRGLAKAEIAISRGKKEYDKRETLKRKDASREMERMRKV